MNRKMLVRLTVFVALVALIAIAALYRNQINSAALETWVKGAGAAGPLMYMVLYAVATFSCGSILAGGAPFRPSVGHRSPDWRRRPPLPLIARYLLRLGDRRTSGWIKQVIDGVEQEGWRFVAFVRQFTFSVQPVELCARPHAHLLPSMLSPPLSSCSGALAYAFGMPGRGDRRYEDLIPKGYWLAAEIMAFLPSVKRFRTARRAPASQALCGARQPQSTGGQRYWTFEPSRTTSESSATSWVRSTYRSTSFHGDCRSRVASRSSAPFVPPIAYLAGRSSCRGGHQSDGSGRRRTRLAVTGRRMGSVDCSGAVVCEWFG